LNGLEKNDDCIKEESRVFNGFRMKQWTVSKLLHMHSHEERRNVIITERQLPLTVIKDCLDEQCAAEH
jgi:hypothetical protein